MVRKSDKRAFDLYLLLLKEFDGNKEGRVAVQYDILKDHLGMETMTRVEYRRQITKTLKKLHEKYHLLDLKLQHGKDAEVLLKDLNNKVQVYQTPNKNFIQIPHTYFTYNWNKTLPFSAKVTYIIGLGNSSLSPTPPTWFASRDKLSEKFGVSKWFLSQGNTQLKRLNLLEIEYAPIEPGNPKERLANRYIPNPLYDQERHQQRIQALEDEYGPRRLKRAQELAAIVYEENDTNALETLIILEDQYGKDIIQEGINVVASKEESNPKRSIAYAIATIKRMGKEKEQTKD